MAKIACQTIIYGNPTIKENIESILANIAEIGYMGVEIGARHFYMDKPDYYLDLLKKYKLEFPAIHVGGDFLNRDSVNEQLVNIEKTAKFAQKVGAKYVYLSGAYKDGKTTEDYQHEAKLYREIGKRCTDAGLTMCYHNHDWEMKDSMKGMNILLNEISCEYMKLVPDVGWLVIAGIDPVKFLKDNLDRIEALHFKDFKGPGMFTELGTGIVDFKVIYDYFKSQKNDFWITAEQDVSAKTPSESARDNFLYFNSLLI